MAVGVNSGCHIYVKIDARRFIGFFFLTFYLDHPDLERITTFMVMVIYSWLCSIAAALFVFSLFVTEYIQYIGQLEGIVMLKCQGKLGMNIKFTHSN